MKKQIEKKIKGVKLKNAGDFPEISEQDIELFITNDEHGITLSLFNEQDNIMYSIPLDEISDNIIEVLNK